MKNIQRSTGLIKVNSNVVKAMELLKENKKGKKYKYDNFIIFYRKSKIVSGDNDKNVFERILLVNGSAEITIKDKIFKVEAPYEIIIPEKTYHKIVGITDIVFLLFKK